MDKKTAISIIVRCVEEYEKNLANRNLLFVYLANNRIDYFEAQFLRSNFPHLAGAVIKDHINANFFYKKCLKRKLSENDFDFKDDGTTVLKLAVLPKLVNFNASIRMAGDFNGSKPRLYIEKVAGGIHCCMGFIRKGNFYVPVTVLKEDTRNIIVQNQQVVAILSKSIKEKKYKVLKYTSKGFTGLDRDMCSDFFNKLDIDNLGSSFFR